MAATRSNQNAQSLPVRCHCPISCLLLLPPGANEFPSSSPVLPDGPEGAGWRSGVKVQQQPVPASGMRTVPFLAGEERARRSGTLLQGTVPCSLLSHALSRGWYSADVHGRLGTEPSLLPGVSSAASSWARVVPYRCPSLEVLWKALWCCVEHQMGYTVGSPGARAALPLYLACCMQAGTAMLRPGAATASPLPGRVLAERG